MQRFFLFFLFSWLTPRSGFSAGYPRAFEIFVDAGSFSISKDQTGETENIREEGSGYRLGFGGSLEIFKKRTLYGSLDFLSANTSGGQKTLGHFEQGLGLEIYGGYESEFRCGLGWQLYYLNSKPIEYGYNTLAGPFFALKYDAETYVLYLKYSPLFNSGTVLASNVNTEIGFKKKLGKSTVRRTYLNLEINQTKFYSKITEETSLSIQTLLGVSRIF